MTKLNHAIGVLSMLLLLVACGADDDQQSPSPASTPSPRPTVTTVTPLSSPTSLPPTLSTTNTPTPYPTRDPLVPTPDFPAALVASSLILSSNSSPDCQLPCWYGLEIGVSTRDEVIDVLDSLFLPDDSFDFFATPPDSDAALQLIWYIDGVSVAGHSWVVEDDTTDRVGLYSIYAYLDINTERLIGVRELLAWGSLRPSPTVLDVIDQLGRPDWVYGSLGANTLGIQLLYKQGIRILLDMGVPSPVQANNFRVCLSDDPVAVSFLVIDPFDYPLDPHTTSVLQQTWIVPDQPAPHVDELFGVSSVREFIEFVNSSDTCLDITR